MPHLLIISDDPSLQLEVEESVAETDWTCSWRTCAPDEPLGAETDLVLLDVRHPLASQDWQPNAPFVTIAPRHTPLSVAPPAPEQDEALVKALAFYESLIDASVDPIIATNLQGTIVLFNPSAEQLSGRPLEEVAGTLDLGGLLGEPPTERLLQQLSSDMFGGRGRLELTNTELVHADGERIPVRLSASLIYEHATPVAIVLILTDLREQQRVERRLAEAQKTIEFNEGQAVLAELAGTAAHELNQPLTSMLAYAELLRRKAAPGSPEEDVATVLTREAERMAEIVRKIGKITRYETTSYVGQQRIFDLDRAAGLIPAKER